MKVVFETAIECSGPKNKDDTEELKRKSDPNDESNEISEKRLGESFAAIKID